MVWYGCRAKVDRYLWKETVSTTQNIVYDIYRVYDIGPIFLMSKILILGVFLWKIDLNLTLKSGPYFPLLEPPLPALFVCGTYSSKYELCLQRFLACPLEVQYSCYSDTASCLSAAYIKQTGWGSWCILAESPFWRCCWLVMNKRPDGILSPNPPLAEKARGATCVDE